MLDEAITGGQPSQVFLLSCERTLLSLCDCAFCVSSGDLHIKLPEPTKNVILPFITW